MSFPATPYTQKELVPQSLEDARYLLKLIIERQTGPSDAGQLLTQSLIQFANDTFNHKVYKKNSPAALMRAMVGDKMANQLGLSKVHGCVSIILTGFLSSFFQLGEKIEQHSEPLQMLLDNISKVSYKMVHYFYAYKAAPFNIPSSLKERWNLE